MKLQPLVAPEGEKPIGSNVLRSLAPGLQMRRARLIGLRGKICNQNGQQCKVVSWVWEARRVVEKVPTSSKNRGKHVAIKPERICENVEIHVSICNKPNP